MPDVGLWRSQVVSAVRAAAGTGLGETLEHCAVCLFNISRLTVGRCVRLLQLRCDNC